MLTIVFLEKLKGQEFNGRSVSASVGTPHNDPYGQNKPYEDEVQYLFNLRAVI